MITESPLIIPPKRTILLYGRTRAGKSSQLGELAEYVKKLYNLNTRLYSSDKGGVDPIRPYIDLGIIDLVEQGDTDPWIFLNRATQGFTRDPKGKWVKGDNSRIGLWAFESMTSFAEGLMADLARRAGQGLSVGGDANVSFQVQGDGESLKISGSNMSHYSVAQTRIYDEVLSSFKLPGVFVVWTANATRDDDPNAAGKVLGPEVCGNKLTSKVPRWFNLTFRMDCLPSQLGKPERHILYLGNHLDPGAGNAVGLGNTRTPLDAPAIKETTVEPASLVKALSLIDGGYNVALDAIRKRLEAGPPQVLPILKGE